jgi:hypothetical protein
MRRGVRRLPLQLQALVQHSVGPGEEITFGEPEKFAFCGSLITVLPAPPLTPVQIGVSRPRDRSSRSDDQEIREVKRAAAHNGLVGGSR